MKKKQLHAELAHALASIEHMRDTLSRKMEVIQDLETMLDKAEATEERMKKVIDVLGKKLIEQDEASISKEIEEEELYLKIETNDLDLAAAFERVASELL